MGGMDPSRRDTIRGRKGRGRAYGLSQRGARGHNTRGTQGRVCRADIAPGKEEIIYIARIQAAVRYAIG